MKRPGGKKKKQIYKDKGNFEISSIKNDSEQ